MLGEPRHPAAPHSCSARGWHTLGHTSRWGLGLGAEEHQPDGGGCSSSLRGRELAQRSRISLWDRTWCHFAGSGASVIALHIAPSLDLESVGPLASEVLV